MTDQTAAAELRELIREAHGLLADLCAVLQALDGQREDPFRCYRQNNEVTGG